MSDWGALFYWHIGQHSCFKRCSSFSWRTLRCYTSSASSLTSVDDGNARDQCSFFATTDDLGAVAFLLPRLGSCIIDFSTVEADLPVTLLSSRSFVEAFPVHQPAFIALCHYTGFCNTVLTFQSYLCSSIAILPWYGIFVTTSWTTFRSLFKKHRAEFAECERSFTKLWLYRFASRGVLFNSIVLRHFGCNVGYWYD